MPANLENSAVTAEPGKVFIPIPKKGNVRECSNYHTIAIISHATVRTRHKTTDWFKIWKGVWQGCILSLCLFNFYAAYIMWSARLEDSQTGIKIARRNNNNLRYGDDITLTAESEEELNSHLMKVQEESEKAGLKLSIQKTKIMESSPNTSWKIDGKNSGKSGKFYFLGLQNHCRQ